MSTVAASSSCQGDHGCSPASTLRHEPSAAASYSCLGGAGGAAEIPGGWQEVRAALLALRERDGAERSEAEARLAESLARLQRSHLELTDFVENGNIGLHWVSPAGQILWANQAELNLLGYAREEYVGQPITRFHAEQPVIQDILQRLTNGETLHHVPARLRAKDGSIKHVLINTSMWVQDGQPHHTRCFTLDVTESERLRAENALLRSALDEAIEGVALLKGDRVLYLNRAQARMFGHDRPEELLGWSWRDFYAPAEQAHLEHAAFPALRRRGHWRGTTLARRRDGSQFVQHLALQALPDGHLISIGSDITAQDAVRQRLEAAHAELTARSEQLRQVNEQLEVAARLKDEFLANMSHELRTPLTAMLGMTDVLRDEIHGPLLPAQQRSVEVIATSSQHLLGLINDILDLAKLGARMLELNLEPVSAARACEAAIEIVRPLAEAKGVELTCQLASDVHTLCADERRLRQILLNLLGNAVKFTPARGVVRLTVTAEAAGRTVRFSVADTGIGIPPEALQELFQPFKQLHGGLARNYEGTGLGLALARRLAELHGGHLTVESTVGQGSCFSVSLPQGDDRPEPPPSTSANGPRPALTPGSPPHRARVLLVDDNEAGLEATETYLAAKGWAMTAARSGPDAIAHAATGEFDLILMDIQMPGMDGLEAIRRIRSLPQGRSLPIIALTALAMSGDRAKCLATGADRYLSKPVELAELNQQMHQLLAPSHP